MTTVNETALYRGNGGEHLPSERTGADFEQRTYRDITSLIKQSFNWQRRFLDFHVSVTTILAAVWAGIFFHFAMENWGVNGRLFFLETFASISFAVLAIVLRIGGSVHDSYQKDRVEKIVDLAESLQYVDV